MTSTDPASHVKITQAGLVALLVSIGGLVAGLVPDWKPYVQVIVAAAPSLVAVVWLIANAIHALSSTIPTVPTSATLDVQAAVRAELDRVLAKGLESPPPAA
jgi:hypothetical protein